VNASIQNLASFAEEYSTNYKILKRLNPWLRQNTLPNMGGRNYVIRMPERGARSTGNGYRE
jgi:hypothetical protein